MEAPYSVLPGNKNLIIFASINNPGDQKVIPVTVMPAKDKKVMHISVRYYKKSKKCFQAVSRIRIRIHMFLGLLDPAPDHSII
jgi:hypothetical protein